MIEALRNQGGIARDIGWDASISGIWRPHATQNIIARLSAAALVPGRGFDQLFTSQTGSKLYYSILANVVLTF